METGQEPQVEEEKIDTQGASSTKTLFKPLPVNVTEMVANRKSKRTATLNDMVNRIHLELYDHSEYGLIYQTFLESVFKEQTVEGSLFCDDIEAARMIRVYAGENGLVYVANQKLATLRLSLNIVLRRYGMSRKERREV